LLKAIVSSFISLITYNAVIFEVIVQPEREANEYHPAPQESVVAKFRVSSVTPAGGCSFSRIEIQCVWSWTKTDRQNAFQD
jgi:hypothetical protein